MYLHQVFSLFVRSTSHKDCFKSGRRDAGPDSRGWYTIEVNKTDSSGRKQSVKYEISLFDFVNQDPCPFFIQLKFPYHGNGPLPLLWCKVVVFVVFL